METVESLEWLRKNNLYDTARLSFSKLKNTFSSCLNVTDEKILILGDKGRDNNRIAPLLAASYYAAANDLNLNTKLVLQEVKTRGNVADQDIIEALEELKEGDVVFINMSDKLGSIKQLGKSFRKFCEKKKSRFVSALSLGDLQNHKFGLVLDAIDINYKVMQTKLESLKSILDDGNEITVSTKKGTDLKYNIEGIKARVSHGNYKEKGEGGNLPAGEIFLPPNKKNVDGIVIVDGSSRNHKHTTLVKDPIKLVIEEGMITSIQGKGEAELLEKSLDWAASKAKFPSLVRRIAELGIGVNPNAKVIGSTLVDEKALGTAHIGIGSNSWFGGNISTIIHLDQIFYEPEIKVDGNKLEI